MHMRSRARLGSALIAATAATITAAVLATPAWAHVEVSADNPQAGARNVTVTFVGEAESSKAGIAAEQVVLPAGISPQDVTLASAPTGWTFTRTADGYKVAGKALPIGDDVTYSIVIAQLPSDATQLAFKTLETYGDGSVARWIEIPKPGAAEPENPAPVLKIKPAAAPAPTTSAAAPTTPSTTNSPTANQAEPTNTSTATAPSASGAGWWTAAAIAVVLVAAGVILVVVRRRRQAPTKS